MVRRGVVADPAKVGEPHHWQAAVDRETAAVEPAVVGSDLWKPERREKSRDSIQMSINCDNHVYLVCSIPTSCSCFCAASAAAAIEGVGITGFSGWGSTIEGFFDGDSFHDCCGICSSGLTSILANGIPFVTVVMAVFFSEISSRRRRTSRSRFSRRWNKRCEPTTVVAKFGIHEQ